MKIPGTYKNHLAHTGTPTNVQKNCIKLSDFDVGITKLLLHREITRNISCREKLFNPKILWFLGPTSHTSSIISASLFRAR